MRVENNESLIKLGFQAKSSMPAYHEVIKAFLTKSKSSSHKSEISKIRNAAVNILRTKLISEEIEFYCDAVTNALKAGDDDSQLLKKCSLVFPGGSADARSVNRLLQFAFHTDKSEEFVPILEKINNVYEKLNQVGAVKNEKFILSILKNDSVIEWLTTRDAFNKVIQATKKVSEEVLSDEEAKSQVFLDWSEKFNEEASEVHSFSRIAASRVSNIFKTLVQCGELQDKAGKKDEKREDDFLLELSPFQRATVELLFVLSELGYVKCFNPIKSSYFEKEKSHYEILKDLGCLDEMQRQFILSVKEYAENPKLDLYAYNKMALQLNFLMFPLDLFKTIFCFSIDWIEKRLSDLCEELEKNTSRLDGYYSDRVRKVATKVQEARISCVDGEDGLRARFEEIRGDYAVQLNLLAGRRKKLYEFLENPKKTDFGNLISEFKPNVGDDIGSYFFRYFIKIEEKLEKIICCQVAGEELKQLHKILADIDYTLGTGVREASDLSIRLNKIMQLCEVMVATRVAIKDSVKTFCEETLINPPDQALKQQKQKELIGKIAGAALAVNMDYQKRPEIGQTRNLVTDVLRAAFYGLLGLVLVFSGVGLLAFVNDTFRHKVANTVLMRSETFQQMARGRRELRKNCGAEVVTAEQKEEAAPAAPAVS